MFKPVHINICSKIILGGNATRQHGQEMKACLTLADTNQYPLDLCDAVH